MPGPLAHSAILLLARQRLGLVKRALRSKVDSGHPVTDLERRVLHLADKAHAYLSTPPHPPLDSALFGIPDAGGTSTFAVMGSMGPDIPAFSAVLTPGQAWVFDTVHKGSPDLDREWVHGGTTDLPLALWDIVSQAVRDEISDPTERDRALARMRAYVLGHVAHVAGDVISHPYTNAIQWSKVEGPSLLTRLAAEEDCVRTVWLHSKAEGAYEADVARKVYGRSTTRAGQAWDVWWPSPDEVPEQLFDAYAEALDRTYGLRSTRRTGFAAWERRHEAHTPPALDPDFVSVGYRTLRRAGIDLAYDWGFGEWFGFLSILTVPMMAVAPLVFALPTGRRLYRPESEGEAGERGTWEMLALPLAAASLMPVALGITVGAVATPRGMEKTYWTTLVFSVLWLILAVVALVLAFAGEEAPAALRWSLLFAFPLAVTLVDMLLPLSPEVGSLPFLHALPLLLPLVAFGVLWLMLVGSARLAGGEDTAMDVVTGVFLGLWMAGWLGLWIGLPFALRDAKVPNGTWDFATGIPHHVRLFDDDSLYHLPGTEPERATSFFPSGPRALATLWWEGDGEMWMRPEREQIAFGFDGSTVEQVVPQPVAPMTLEAYLAFLRETVRGPGGDPGDLRGAVAEPTDPDYVLPAGAVFAVPGDCAGTLEEAAEERSEWTQLGSAEDDSNAVLQHVPKAERASRFTRLGTAVDPLTYDPEAGNRDGDTGGFRFTHDPTADPGDPTIMGLAADLAALLAMGTTSHMLSEAERAVPHAGRVDPLRQVFRNWNLDRRRVNEWRMLVAGGAVNEKGGTRQGPDPVMPAGTPDDWVAPLHGSGDAAFDEGERTAREFGWIPTFRAWIEVVRRTDQDPMADERFDPNAPTNRALSRAMAYLLDMTDPAPAP